MYNLRYHVASLAAVFLALSVGLILGTAIADRSQLDKRQRQLIASVETEFTRLRADNAVLAREVVASRTLGDQALADYGAGRLTGERILIIVEGSGSPPGADTLSAKLTDAGAKTQRLEIRRQGFGLDDQRVLDAVRASIEDTSADAPRALTAIQTSLPADLVRPGGGTMLTALVQAGVIGLTPDATPAATGVVLYYSGPDPTMPDQMPIAERLLDLRVPLVGVQTSVTDPSAVPTMRDGGVTTVDDVDNPMGQLSTILVLSRKDVHGQFGSQPGATAPMPPLGTSGRP
jgi:hypothetical protein